jgi:DNA-binding transcriptional regulator YiaG
MAFERQSWAERVKAIRKQLGWSQEALARALHADSSTIRRWEMGWHDPLPRFQQQLLQIMMANPARRRARGRRKRDAQA